MSYNEQLTTINYGNLPLIDSYRIIDPPPRLRMTSAPVPASAPAHTDTHNPAANHK